MGNTVALFPSPHVHVNGNRNLTSWRPETTLPRSGQYPAAANSY
jgi:hypothetical protein